MPLRAKLVRSDPLNHTRVPDQSLADRDMWSSLFREAYHEKGHSVRAVAKVLKKGASASDYRQVVRDYRDGSRGPKNAERAWEIGEALRENGLAWCSGALALFAADYMAEFVWAVANLARRGFVEDAVVTTLFAEHVFSGVQVAQQLLSTVKRPAQYDARDIQAPRVDVAFRIAALIASRTKDLTFHYRALRIGREMVDMIDHRLPQLAKDHRVMAALFTFETQSTIDHWAPSDELVRWAAHTIKREASVSILRGEAV